MWLEQTTKPPVSGRCSAPRQSRQVNSMHGGPQTPRRRSGTTGPAILVGTLPLLPSRRPSRVVRSRPRQRVPQPRHPLRWPGPCRGNPRRRDDDGPDADHRPHPRPADPTAPATVPGAWCCPSRARPTPSPAWTVAPGVSRTDAGPSHGAGRPARPPWPARRVGRGRWSSPPTRWSPPMRVPAGAAVEPDPGHRPRRRRRRGIAVWPPTAMARWPCCWPTCRRCVPEDLTAALDRVRGGTTRRTCPDAEGSGTVLLAAARPDLLQPGLRRRLGRTHDAGRARGWTWTCPGCAATSTLAESLRGAVALGVGPRTVGRRWPQPTPAG